MSRFSSRTPHSKITISNHKPEEFHTRSISIRALSLSTPTDSNNRSLSPQLPFNINRDEIEASKLTIKCEIPWPEDLQAITSIESGININHIGKISKDVAISPKGFRTPQKLPMKYQLTGPLLRSNTKLMDDMFPTLPQAASPSRNGIREPNKKIAYYNLLRTKDIRSHKSPRSKKLIRQINSPREIKLSTPSPYYSQIFPAFLSSKTQISPDGNIIYYKSFNFVSNSRLTRKSPSKPSVRASNASLGPNPSKRTLYSNYTKILLGEEKETRSIERNLELEGQRMRTVSKAKRASIEKESQDFTTE